MNGFSLRATIMNLILRAPSLITFCKCSFKMLNVYFFRLFYCLSLKINTKRYKLGRKAVRCIRSMYFWVTISFKDLLISVCHNRLYNKTLFGSHLIKNLNKLSSVLNWRVLVFISFFFFLFFLLKYYILCYTVSYHTCSVWHSFFSSYLICFCHEKIKRTKKITTKMLKRKKKTQF